ncbi:SAM-dependent methyltransferase [Corynebacterium heidelbergense]|uniref:SAM-dependent methyltransferase n=1 Tax=Corynebacterium heidelbergense TaxID=2055947 RepID=A0A364V7G2_9CORY|nr:SAM-dependent methyltransferase [Corynebacterium heidelbergense]
MVSFSAEELSFLTSASGAQALQRVQDRQRAGELQFSGSNSLASVATLRQEYGQMGRAIVELLRAREVLGRKMPAPMAQAWLADQNAAEQATPWAVAEFRAVHLHRVGVRTMADVTCSVGTELAAGQASVPDVVGSDMDDVRLRMARENVPGVPVARADATCPVWDVDAVVADPGRRNSSGRVSRVEDLQPPLPDLVGPWRQRGVELAVKCAPGLDFTQVQAWAGQIDVVSVDGAVKEACVYTPGLCALGLGGTAPAGSPVRRAVVLGQRPVLLTSQDEQIEPEDRGPGEHGRFIVDPDGAIVRAGLVRHYAARHGLWQLDPRIAYLTGPRVPEGHRGFEVHEWVPMKKLKAALKARQAGAVEILVRGVDVNPDQLRKSLKLRGTQPWSVVLTRVGKSAVAYLCQPVTG